MFLKYTLQLCKDEGYNSKNEVSNLQTESFKTEKSDCRYVKNKLQNVYMRYWSEQLQPAECRGKLRIFKKINFFVKREKYLLYLKLPTLDTVKLLQN